MNKRYGFENEMGATLDYGIHFLSYPVFDFGTEKIDSIEVPGRVGTLIEEPVNILIRQLKMK